MTFAKICLAFLVCVPLAVGAFLCLQSLVGELSKK